MVKVLIGSCTQCGDCCGAGVSSPNLMRSRKNLITFIRNGSEETWLYCDYAYAKDNKLYCKLVEKFISVLGTVDLTKPLNTELLTPEFLADVTSEIDGSPIPLKLAEGCCKLVAFPESSDLEVLSAPSKVLGDIDRLHELCPNCTKEIVDGD